jgi:TRAP-type C4-dicarboxylate transport system substrate-binding protein
MEVATWHRNEIVAVEGKQLDEMAAKGAKVSKPELGAFRKTVLPVYDKAKEKYGAAEVEALIKEAEAIRSANPAK